MPPLLLLTAPLIFIGYNVCVGGGPETWETQNLNFMALFPSFLFYFLSIHRRTFSTCNDHSSPSLLCVAKCFGGCFLLWRFGSFASRQGCYIPWNIFSILKFSQSSSHFLTVRNLNIVNFFLLVSPRTKAVKKAVGRFYISVPSHGKFSLLQAAL